MMQTPKRRERIAGWRVSALHFGRICSDRIVFFARAGAEPSAPVGGEFPTFSPPRCEGANYAPGEAIYND
jgi:hypothetical protein